MSNQNRENYSVKNKIIVKCTYPSVLKKKRKDLFMYHDFKF